MMSTVDTESRERIRGLLRRADTQLESLRKLLVEADKSPPFAIAIGAGSATVVRADEPDPELEHLFREAVGNTRIALDRTVAYLARTSIPAGSKHRGAFPIFISKDDYYRENRNRLTARDQALRHVPEEARLHIDTVQPFTATNPAAHPLALLAELSNEDKHRYGQPAYVLMRNTAIALADREGAFVQVWDLTPEEPPIGSRVAMTVGVDAFAQFPSKAIEPFREYLDEPNDGRWEAKIITRVGIGFGPLLVLWPEIRDCLEYVERAVVSPLLDHLD